MFIAGIRIRISILIKDPDTDVHKHEMDPKHWTLLDQSQNNSVSRHHNVEF